MSSIRDLENRLYLLMIDECLPRFAEVWADKVGAPLDQTKAALTQLASEGKVRVTINREYGAAHGETKMDPIRELEYCLYQWMIREDVWLSAEAWAEKIGVPVERTKAALTQLVSEDKVKVSINREYGVR